MATIKEVAKHAGVSVGTVSNVLAGTVPVGPDLRKRVEAAIRKLDYHPNHSARSLKTKQTKTLGMVIPDITNPFFPQIVRGAEDAALNAGYLVVTFNTDDRLDREKQALSVSRSRGLDGVLLVVAPGYGDISHIEALIATGKPVVCVDRVPPGVKVDSVTVDNVKGVRMCIQHLTMLGHRHIAIITGDLALQNARERLEGYRLAYCEGGLEINPEWIIEGNFRAETGYRLAKELLLRGTRPTALFASNGMIAIGVLQALEEVGLKCPDDIAIASFDDLWVCSAFRPHLTVVAQPGYEMGFQAARLLTDRLDGRRSETSPVNIRLEPDLKIRESTMGRLLRSSVDSHASSLAS